MSAPEQNTPQPQQASRALSAGAVAAIVIGAFLASVAVFGLCAGIISFAFPAAQTALRKANVPVPDVTINPGGQVTITPAQPMAVNPAVNDWWAERVLSDVYAHALDTVVANKTVIERLGDPVETDIAAETLYHRVNTGELNTASETIEFDILGPKGRGTVSVVVAGAAGAAGAGIGSGPVQFKEIHVTLDDGTVSGTQIQSCPWQPLQVRRSTFSA
jgi:hypothetical protein